MKTLCIAAVVVLSLISGCQAASLACEKLLKPVDKVPDIRGSWYLIAISSQQCWFSTLLNSVLWPSIEVHFTSKDTPNIYSGEIKIKLYGHCDTETRDYLMESNTLTDVNINTTKGETNVLLQSGCPDCIVMKNTKDNTLFLLSRRMNVTDAELKEFETQAQCLGWIKPEVTNSDHDYENCPRPGENSEATLRVSTLIYNRLQNTYVVALKCFIETLYYKPKDVLEAAVELLDS